MDEKYCECDKWIKSTSIDQCIYTKCYCEENVWKLCEKIRIACPACLEQTFVVFISNNNKTVPIWYQKARKTDTSPVVWDYHVILVHKRGRHAQIFDLDTVLPFPCDFDVYVNNALRSDNGFPEMFHRKLRVVPSKDYLDYFASDRSHMLKEDGSWQACPPDYPPIAGASVAGGGTNLNSYIDMTSNGDCYYGTVYSLEEFRLLNSS